VLVATFSLTEITSLFDLSRYLDRSLAKFSESLSQKVKSPIAQQTDKPVYLTAGLDTQTAPMSLVERWRVTMTWPMENLHAPTDRCSTPVDSTHFYQSRHRPPHANLVTIIKQNDA